MTIFRDEAHIIKEFVEHYLWQGVDHLYLIDNGSIDNAKEVLEEYIKKGLVSYYYLPEKFSQVQHYNTVYKDVKSEWLLVCDIDEFVFGTEKNLKETMKEVEENYHTILTQWWMFGCNGYVKQPKEVRTSFLYREPEIHPLVKSFYRTSKHRAIVNVHSPIGCFAYYGEGIKTENEKIKLYHYPIQSFEYFENIKIPRGDASCHNYMRDLLYFEKYDKKADYYDDILANLVKHG